MTSASTIDLVFSTNRFNSSEPRPYFINDCCYGDDLAAWLAERLRPRGFRVGEPGQEDWGWYLNVSREHRAWFLAIGLTASDADFGRSLGAAYTTEPASTSCGEWRLILKKRRTLWQKLTCANRISHFDELLVAICKVVREELGVPAHIDA